MFALDFSLPSHQLTSDPPILTTLAIAVFLVAEDRTNNGGGKKPICLLRRNLRPPAQQQEQRGRRGSITLMCTAQQNHSLRRKEDTCRVRPSFRPRESLYEDYGRELESPAFGFARVRLRPCVVRPPNHASIANDHRRRHNTRHQVSLSLALKASSSLPLITEMKMHNVTAPRKTRNTTSLALQWFS